MDFAGDPQMDFAECRQAVQQKERNLFMVIVTQTGTLIFIHFCADL